MANRIVLQSHFKEAIREADKETREAIEKAVREGEKAANIAIERTNTRRGYNLPTTVESFHSEKSGGIQAGSEFWWKFFEYGTVFIDAVPFIRPGHRKMRAVFKEEMGELFEGWRTLRRR